MYTIVKVLGQMLKTICEVKLQMGFFLNLARQTQFDILLKSESILYCSSKLNFF